MFTDCCTQNSGTFDKEDSGKPFGSRFGGVDYQGGMCVGSEQPSVSRQCALHIRFSQPLRIHLELHPLARQVGLCGPGATISISALAFILPIPGTKIGGRTPAPPGGRIAGRTAVEPTRGERDSVPEPGNQRKKLQATPVSGFFRKHLASHRP